MSILDPNVTLSQMGKAKKIRPAAVAGTFYPGDPVELSKMIEHCFDGTAELQGSPAAKAVIAPHAGYIYSGPVAARAYASLIQARKTIKRVVILGPAHRVYLEGIACSSADMFRTPLGNIPIDKALCRHLLELPQVHIMDAAHAQEHSLEVHLPFLQSIFDDFTLVPLVVGKTPRDKVKEVLERAWGGDETLIIISSDLSHYHNYETAQRHDSSTSDAIEQCDYSKIGPQQACGCFAVNGLLDLAHLNRMRIQRLDVRNSGDTAGNKDRVVGYGAYSVHLPQDYSYEQEKKLLCTASDSIKNGLKHGTALQVSSNDYDLVLRHSLASFVTLKIDGKLRGCIGTTEAVSPLIEGVAHNAFQAAFHDPRFKALSEKEFEKIDLSISILSQAESFLFSSEQDLCEQLQPGRDGLIIEKNHHRATFLPEVWASIPDPKTFLQQLKQKAGIPHQDAPERAWRYRSYHIKEH